MMRTALTRTTGIILTMIGLFAMIGWYAHIPLFISIYLGQINIVFNSALGFCLIGITFLFSPLNISLQNKIYTITGTLITVLAILTLSQNIFNYSLGIDQLFIEPWLIDNNPHPGRMADNSALIFLFSGLTFVLFPYTAKKNIFTIVQICIFSTLILGFVALAGYIFGLKAFYSWNLNTQMSLLSAIGNSFLGLGLWSLWNLKENKDAVQPGMEGKKVVSISFTIFLCTILLSSFAIIQMLFPIAEINNHLVEIKFSILMAIIVGMGVLLLQLIPLIRQMIISEKKLIDANFHLKESENRFRTAFDSASIGMALILPNGRLIKVNNALCDILGYIDNELLGQEIYSFMHTEDLQKYKLSINEMLTGKQEAYQNVNRYLHKNGDIIWVSMNMSLICDNNNLPLYFIIQLQNITHEKKVVEQLKHLAYHDALTGLYNRNSLEQKMQEIISNVERHKTGFSLIFLDLDRFKNINDTIGHDAGDILLQVVAQRLKHTVRVTDLIARIGGDEFVIVLNELNQAERISNIAQKILLHLMQPIAIKGHEIYVTTSIGISVYPYDGHDVQTLLKNADLALYRAKELGRNNYQFCTLEMTVKAQEKMSRQNAIVQAMAKNEFELYYQPKLNLADKSISGVEALLRWPNSEYTNINAAEIIHLAEETGLIIALNEWVFKTACLQVKEWHKAGFLSLNLSVNLSIKQFKQANFVQNLLDMLNKTGFPPEFLELEITEGLIIQDPEYILHILHFLKSKNISIAIDDFGTGYSSLDYLSRFSIDSIKIDRKFIQTLTSDTASASVVSAIIAMSNKLGIKTIAEGVETKEQYDFLLQEKCTEVQGYYLSPPANVKTISQFLKNPVLWSS